MSEPEVTEQELLALIASAARSGKSLSSMFKPPRPRPPVVHIGGACCVKGVHQNLMDLSSFTDAELKRMVPEIKAELENRFDIEEAKLLGLEPTE